MGKLCFLFGHSDTPQDVLPALEQAIETEIACGVTTFYVGYHGDFDRLAASALRKAKSRHNEILLLQLLAYHPAEKAIEIPLNFDGSYYPPLETVPRRYAIVHANQYMVRMADSIICYVKYAGNTRALWNLAQRQMKKRPLRLKNLAAEMT